MLDAGSAQRVVDAAGLVFSVTTCTRLHGGDNSAAYELFDADRVEHLVMKVYGERMTWKMGKEVLVYGLLASVPVPTPEILFVDDSRQLVDANYALMTRLPGSPASTVSEAVGAAEVRDIWRQIGAVARAFHTVVFEEFGYLGPDGVLEPVSGNRTHMTRILDNHLRTFREKGGDPAVADAVERRLTEDIALLDTCDQPVLCHDDLHENNVLVEQRNGRWIVTGVVDVENASAADPMLDLPRPTTTPGRRSSVVLACSTATDRSRQTGRPASRCTAFTTRWRCGPGSPGSAGRSRFQGWRLTWRGWP